MTPRTKEELAPLILEGKIVTPYLTDTEVSIMKNFFATLADGLSDCGPLMRLSWWAALQAHRSMSDIQRARKEK